MKKFKKSYVGCYTIVRWDCVGVREGILTDIDDNRMSARWFPLGDDASQIIDISQVVSVGKLVKCVQ